MEVFVVFSFVVIVVYKVFNVVMGTDVFNVLRSEKIFFMKDILLKWYIKRK